MSDLNNQINLALRTAAGHERAALAAEAQGNKSYEMKMKSAGASVYEAFALAFRAENPGRKIDDKRIAQVYQSNTPRPWWDKHLATVKADGKPATRDWGKRLIQWHLDPAAAIARKAMVTAKDANYRKRLAEQRNSSSQGARTPRQPSSETNERHAATIREASVVTALGGRELQNFEQNANAAVVTLDDLLKEVSRITAEARRVHADDRGAALQILQSVRLV